MITDAGGSEALWILNVGREGIPMFGTKRFERLLAPLDIKHVRFRNRMVKAGQILGYAEKAGYVGQRNMDFYETLAKGGAGMIIVEDASIDFPLGGSGDKRILVTDDKFIPSLARLTKVIHKHGCPVFQQIGHVGPAHNQKYSGQQPVAASTLSKDEMLEMFSGRAYSVARSLTIQEIEDLFEKFAESAERVKKAQFDGIEVHAGHSYLINSFLSRAWNRREDEYGFETMENRCRFAVGVVRAIKNAVGQDFPVGLRINGGEYGIDGGITPQESQEVAKALENAGADYIHVTGYGYGRFFRLVLPEQIFYPEAPSPLPSGLVKRPNLAGPMVPLAAAIKRVVTIPVIAVGRLDPFLGERILRKGETDLIAMGRRLMADPELPNKVAAGRLEDIRPCTGCATCSDLFYKDKHVTCRANAALGKEGEYNIKPAEQKKKVVIVGGGPAGMEAARVASLRGHRVTLYEKNPRLGGSLPLAAFVKGVAIEDLPALNRYLETQLRKQGVTIRLGAELDQAQIKALKPDVLVLATGGRHTLPDIPGIRGPNVMTNEKVLGLVSGFLRILGPGMTRRLTKLWMPLGKRTVIMGGLIQGCQLAVFLMKRDRRVTVLEETSDLGDGMLAFHKIKVLDWLKKKGATLLPEIRYQEVNKGGLIVKTEEGNSRSIGADTILLATALEPETGAFEHQKEEVPEVYLGGDCRSPGLIVDAIADGFRIGRRI